MALAVLLEEGCQPVDGLAQICLMRQEHDTEVIRLGPVETRSLHQHDLGFLELLRETRVMLVQGTGFNWQQPDHFRIVFLPHEDDLREAIGRIAKFLEGYRKRNGT